MHTLSVKTITPQQNMGKIVFACSGLKDTWQFRFEDGFISISEASKGDELIFNENDLTIISYANHPWMIQGCNVDIEITFNYNYLGRQRKKCIILKRSGNNITELLDFLQNRYGQICRIRPTEKERAEILSPAYAATYRLHNLHILTPLGVISGLLLIFVLVLYLIIYTTDQAILPAAGKMNQAGILIIIFSLIPLGIMYLILTKRLMVARTDQKGLTVRVILSRHYQWERLTIKAQKPVVHKVYRGLYCEASDHGEVVAAKALADIHFSTENKKEVKLLIPGDEAGRFYRELYYRGKVSLDEAKQAGAFP